jgi:hypothetical protein
MTVTVPVPAANNLFTTEQLEQWKDELAAWWGKESLRYDHKKVVELFRNYFGVTKKKAIQMEYNSREEPEKFIEQFLNFVVIDFRKKLQKDKLIVRLDVKMTFQHGAFAAIEFPVGSGQMQKHDVDGHVGIVGKVFYKDGTTQTIFQRFVSHPFWQYSHRSSN